MALPLTGIVNNTLVALPLSGGATGATPAPNADEVEYYMTLFENYTKEQIEKELESSKKSRVAAALATAATRGKEFLDKFFKKKVAAGEAQGVGEMLETAFGAADTAKPSVAARMQAAASTATAAASKALGDFYSWASAKAAEGGPKVKEWAAKAAAAFVALWGIIKCAVFRARSWKPDLKFLANIERVGIINARYGTPVLPGAPSLKLNANTNRYILVDRYKEFTKPDLKQALTNFSSKYSLSNATKGQLEGIVKRMMLDQVDGRFLKNRYAGQIKKLISNENWEKIKKGNTTLQQTLARLKLPTVNGNRVGRLIARYALVARPRETTLQQPLARLKLPTLNGNRVGRLNARYALVARPSAAAPSAAQQKSISNVMSNPLVQDAFTELVTKHGLTGAEQNLLKSRLAAAAGNAASAAARLKQLTKPQFFMNIYGAQFNNRTPIEKLLNIRSSREYQGWRQNVQKELDETLRKKMYEQANRVARENINFVRLERVARAIRNTRGNLPGSTTYSNSLRRVINRLGSSVNSVRINENRLRRIAASARGMTGINSSIRNAQGRIARLRREENSRRRERGLAPLARNYGYNNRGSSRIPYYPSNVRPPSYGNMRPMFEPQPNRPQPSVVPVAPPLQPFPSIPANNRSRQAPMPNMRTENILPPTEAAAVTNVGGVNKALNLVENAGGVANVVNTAKILKNVGNNPNAAVAAGANAKNVKIVLQLGGANNALKVASAVPKLKKRRRSKKAKKVAKPKAPRVKELKKLIKFLGTKEELVKKLPDPENKEKKLTKNQVVAKITTHLLRKGRGKK